MDSGVARMDVELGEYRDRLRAKLGPGYELMREMRDRARRKRQGSYFRKVITIRSTSERRASWWKMGFANQCFWAAPPYQEKGGSLGVDISGVEVIYAADLEEERSRYAEQLFGWARKGLTFSEAEWNLF